MNQEVTTQLLLKIHRCYFRGRNFDDSRVLYISSEETFRFYSKSEAFASELHRERVNFCVSLWNIWNMCLSTFATGDTLLNRLSSLLCIFKSVRMNIRLHLFTHMWTYSEWAILKRNAFNEIYSANSINICICLTTV